MQQREDIARAHDIHPGGENFRVNVSPTSVAYPAVGATHDGDAVLVSDHPGL